MTVAYNEHLSATKGAWWQQEPTYRRGPAIDDDRDRQVAARRYTGAWLSEEDVMGALERTDG